MGQSMATLMRLSQDLMAIFGSQSSMLTKLGGSLSVGISQYLLYQFLSPIHSELRQGPTVTSGLPP